MIVQNHKISQSISFYLRTPEYLGGRIIRMIENSSFCRNNYHYLTEKWIFTTILRFCSIPPPKHFLYRVETILIGSSDGMRHIKNEKNTSVTLWFPHFDFRLYSQQYKVFWVKCKWVPVIKKNTHQLPVTSSYFRERWRLASSYYVSSASLKPLICMQDVNLHWLRNANRPPF